MGALKMREWKMREQIAGVANSGVIMRRNPSEEISVRVRDSIIIVSSINSVS